MNNKQLAEMIKVLRKQKLDEYQVRSGPTTSRPKLPSRLSGDIDKKNQPKGGNDIANRYRPSIPVEEEKVDAKKKNTIINTTPEQDSAMVGTQ